MKTTSKIQAEWDYSSYMRKFQQTLAYTQIGDAPPEWKWIATFTDDGFVYSNARTSPFGQVLFQCNGSNPMKNVDNYPIVSLHYVCPPLGAYWDKARETIYYLSRRHLKSYKIGLSDETLATIQCYPGGMQHSRITSDIDLLNPVSELTVFGTTTVFTQKLVKIGHDLIADGNVIGFMEGDVCVLRHKGFIPLIKPVLGEQWQIES